MVCTLILFVKKYGRTSLFSYMCWMPCLCMARLSVCHFVAWLLLRACGIVAPTCVWHCRSSVRAALSFFRVCVWPVCAPQGLAAKYMKKAVKVDLVEKQGMQASTDVAHYMLLVRTGCSVG